LADTSLSSDLIIKLQTYVLADQPESDADFCKGVAASMAKQSPPPTAAGLIFMFQFIALSNPPQKPLQWDSWTQANLTDTVKAKFAIDKKSGIEMLGR
jgi:hypothetical protein